MGLVDDLTKLTSEHTLNARKTWPGVHACSCGWQGKPPPKKHHGKFHHVHVAEVLAEWFEEQKDK